MSSPDLVGQAMALDVGRSLSFEAVRCARGGATDRLSDPRHARSRASSSAKGYGSSPSIRRNPRMRVSGGYRTRTCSPLTQAGRQPQPAGVAGRGPWISDDKQRAT